MRNFYLITPEGTKDLLFDECIIRREIEDKIHNIFNTRGYCELITPGLEYYDVFTLNSRYFPQEALYKLIDNKGRLLVLRPDSTIPIARVVATRLKDAVLPLRLYYNQSIYAINPSLTGRSDQVAQMGIELIGSSSRMADLEVISTAIDVLSACSNDNFSLEIGDVGFFKELMCLLNVDDDIKENIRHLIEMKNYPALNDLLDSLGDNKVNNALKQLPRLFGGKEVFKKASKLFSNPKIDEILTNLERLYKDISKLNINGKITVDLGMVNRTDYYTGVIIKGYLAGYGEEVLSGGRYDKLISEFGYDVPATGFAVNVNAVSAIIAKDNRKRTKPCDAIVFAEEGFEIKAIKVANKMRSKGRIVEMALFDDLETVREYAKERNVSEIVIVDEEYSGGGRNA
ncbi:MAG: ATP phosphoribosyltransferase regulatory subunit [Clostridiales bacterium]|nr:ATP phosphoribosyltransferase regulatory subunit [Clostridiales bacterium]